MTNQHNAIINEDDIDDMISSLVKPEYSHPPIDIREMINVDDTEVKNMEIEIVKKNKPIIKVKEV